MIFKTNINGIDVEAFFSEDDIQNRYIPFLKMLTVKQKEKESAGKPKGGREEENVSGEKSTGSRLFVMLAAPPGCGKTTLLCFLKKLSEETEGVSPVNVIGMDGFHRYQDYLTSHTVIRDGVEIPMVKIKGAPVTFDLEKLTDAVKKVAAGENTGWPSYNRMTHNPQENASVVSGNIVILEGNYLLLDDEGWRDLRQYADLTVKLTEDEEVLRKRLVERHIKSGKSPEAARAFVEYSDMPNAKICLECSGRADIEW